MTSVMSDKVLPMVVAALAASLGLWLGATTEQSALVELITRVDLTPECRA